MVGADGSHRAAAAKTAAAVPPISAFLVGLPPLPPPRPPSAARGRSTWRWLCPAGHRHAPPPARGGRPRAATGVITMSAAAAFPRDDGAGGGGGEGTATTAAAAGTGLPPHLTTPPPPTAEDVTRGVLHGWLHPTLLSDGRWYGLAGEWGYYGDADGTPGTPLATPAATALRGRIGGGARLWSWPPAAPGTAGGGVQVNLYTPAGVSKTGDAAVPRGADGLAQKSWPSAFPAGSHRNELVRSPGAGVDAAFFAGPGGGVWAVPDGPTAIPTADADAKPTAAAVGAAAGAAAAAAPGQSRRRGVVPPGWTFLELFLRDDPAAAASVSVAWPAGATAPSLRSLIREARVGGWEGITDDDRAVALPVMPPAPPPVPVEEWRGGYPGPSDADAGAGVATVVAWVYRGGIDDDGETPRSDEEASGSDGGFGSGGRRLVSWTVEGVRWTPVGGGRAGGASRVVALEEGLYLAAMADARAGGVVEFGRATPPPWGGGRRQRVLVVMAPGGSIDRVVTEVYPAPGGGKA